MVGGWMLVVVVSSAASPRTEIIYSERVLVRPFAPLQTASATANHLCIIVRT